MCVPEESSKQFARCQLLWMTYFVISIVVARCAGLITEKPVDTVVHLGGTTRLKCSSSNTSEIINWYHCRIGKSPCRDNYVFVYGEMFYGQRFRIESDNKTGSSSLIISGVEQADAGLYICQCGGDAGHKAQLTVLDSVSDCDTSIGPDEFIGLNSCGQQDDFIQISCHFKYFGNILPNFSGLLLLKNKTTLYLPDAMTGCENNSGAIFCNFTIPADVYADGLQLLVQRGTSRNMQYYSISDTIGVKYAFCNETPAVTNSTFCNYTLMRFDREKEQFIPNKAHTAFDVLRRHRWKALCQLRDASSNFNTTMIQAPDKEGRIPITYVTGISVVIISILLAAAVTVFLCCKKGKYQLPRRREYMNVLYKQPPSQGNIDQQEPSSLVTKSLKTVAENDKKTKESVSICENGHDSAYYSKIGKEDP